MRGFVFQAKPLFSLPAFPAATRGLSLPLYVVTMNSIVNARLKQIKPSPSMAAKIVVDELRRQGREIADFTLGEPDMATPAHIARAGQEAIASGDIRYTSPNGTVGLRRAIANSLELG